MTDLVIPERFAWTDDRVELLRKMFAAGASATKIARCLGKDVTRNAVIGKVHRLGLRREKITRAVDGVEVPPWVPADLRGRYRKIALEHGEEDAADWARRAKGRSSSKAAPQTAPRTVSPPVSPTPVAPFALPSEPAPPPLGSVALMDLRNRHCRFPVDAPGEPMRYCGAGKVDPAKPYCAKHAAIAYVPPSEQRRRDRDTARAFA